MKHIFIGGAWPYANGELHIGHIAGLLNGDILARYHRQKGDHVLYVSGSDCHGTPITLSAKEENKSPEAIAQGNHQAIEEGFRALNFSYDQYGKTTDPIHKDNVQHFFKQLDHKGLIYEKEVPQHYCTRCDQFLADRYILAICPHCGSNVRGDECETCNNPIDLLTLKDTICSICLETTILKANKNLYFKLSQFSSFLDKLLTYQQDQWRPNAIALTKRYIDEGLRDRAYSRDLSWGIPIPRGDYAHKTIYIWLENILGYTSMAKKWCKENNKNSDDYLKQSPKLKSYYVHAKDNIPFHTVILPALLQGVNESYNLPDQIVSNEYLTLEGRKISTSSGWAIWVNDFVKRYDPESLRHYLTSHSPEKKDSNFTFEDFIYTHNSDLVGQLGNLVHRTLSFINKYFDGQIAYCDLFDDNLESTSKTQDPLLLDLHLAKLYLEVGQSIEKGHIKSAYKSIFTLVRDGNVLFDREAPWKSRTSNIVECKRTLYKVCLIIVNIANLLAPFLPATSLKIFELCGHPKPLLNWSVIDDPATIRPSNNLTLLFDRIPIEFIDKEREDLAQL